MTKPTISQSQKRFQESLGQLFSSGPEALSGNIVFLTSSSDLGVIRNGGRNGARFAPKSFLATFKKLTQSERLPPTQFTQVEVSCEKEEEINFEAAQKTETQKIITVLDHCPESPIYHIGGGHDHIYPLLSAFAKNWKKIIVLNIDAHADTRTDENKNSGTPFRQFSEEFDGEFILYQIGLHPFANSRSTLNPLKKGGMPILWRNEISQERLTKLFSEIQLKVTSETLVVFSLDADALSGTIVPGVSAVNHDGLTLEELRGIWREYKKLNFSHQPVMGVYELNPLYDSLSSLSMRTMAGFVFETLLELRA